MLAESARWRDAIEQDGGIQLYVCRWTRGVPEASRRAFSVKSLGGNGTVPHQSRAAELGRGEGHPHWRICGLGGHFPPGRGPQSTGTSPTKGAQSRDGRMPVVSCLKHFVDVESLNRIVHDDAIGINEAEWGASGFAEP